MNQSLINANIFFFITSVSVVVLTVMIIIFLFYIIRIARDLKQTSEKIKEEGGRIIDDVSILRESMEEHGGKLVSIFRFISGSFFGGAESKARAEKRKHKKAKKSSARGE